MLLSLKHRVIIGMTINCLMFLGLWICDVLKFPDEWILIFSSIPFTIVMRCCPSNYLWFFLQAVVFVFLAILSTNLRRFIAICFLWIGVNLGYTLLLIRQ